MLRNYIIIAFRNLSRRRFYSFINITGLAIAIAIAITAWVTVHYMASANMQHQKKDQLYFVTTVRSFNGQTREIGSTPTPLADHINKNIPGIVNFSRFTRSKVSIRRNDEVSEEVVYWVDDSFFDMFTFKVLSGNPELLKDRNSVIITDEMASRYFGDEDPLGKEIIVNPLKNKEYVFKVAAVMQKPAPNSSLKFNIVLPYIRQTDMLGYDIESWGDWTSATFLELEKGTDPGLVQNQMQQFIPIANEANGGYLSAYYNLTPLTKLASKAARINGHPFEFQSSVSEYVFTIVTAILVLFLSSINFINTAIAYAAGRMKEIAVRKVVGSNRSQLITQFLGENLILVFMALILGTLLSIPFTNWFNSLLSTSDIRPDHLQYPQFWVFLIVLLLITALGAGAYPAYYISRFDVIRILQGRQQAGGTNRKIRILLVFQFSLAVIAIFAGLVMLNNTKYIMNFNLGFNIRNVLVVPVDTFDRAELLKSRLASNPDILEMSTSQHLMNTSHLNKDIRINNDMTRVTTFDVRRNFLSCYGLKLISGKSFDEMGDAEAYSSIIVNESFIQRFGLESTPVGTYGHILLPEPGTDVRIAGVIKDIYQNGLFTKAGPLMLRFSQPEQIQYLSILFREGSASQIGKAAESVYQDLFPNLPYKGFYYYQSLMGHSLEITKGIQKIFRAIAILTLFISAMGFYSLISLNIARRGKEIGVRRVLGASLSQISYLIFKEFILILLSASVLGTASGYFLINSFLDSIWAYHADVNAWPFIISLIVIFAITTFTVLMKIINITRINVVESLRYE